MLPYIKNKKNELKAAMKAWASVMLQQCHKLPRHAAMMK